MNPAAKLSSVLLLAAALPLACGGEPPPAPTKVAATPAEDPAAPPEAEVAKTDAPKITSDEPVHDFGAIKPTDTAEHVFTIRNVGGADLKIERVEKT
jgi:hypothetical protein